MSTPGRLSTCGRCGGTIQQLPALAEGSRRHWSHITPPSFAHAADPDDSAVARPDPEECNACHHAAHDEAGEELCETRVSTGQYGTDGELLTRWCPCTGSIPTGAPAVAPDPWTDPAAAAAHQPPPF